MIRKRHFAPLAFGLLATVAQATDVSAYADVLKTHVNDAGRVNYAALSKDPAPLNRYLDSLKNADPKAFAAQSEPQRLATWINAYNAFTLKSIIDHYPLTKLPQQAKDAPRNSIRQIPGVWKKRTHSVLGRSLTLDQIEHEVIRKEFKEPRIHMALVCASIGCPLLRNEPYAASKLEDQLADQTRKFLRESHAFKVDERKKTLYVSALFDWFKDDFTWSHKGKGPRRIKEPMRSVVAFVDTYTAPVHDDFLQSGKFTIKHTAYDWALNEQ